MMAQIRRLQPDCQEIRMCPCDNVVDAVRQIKAWGAL